MEIQKFFDALSGVARDTRSQYHLTLGRAIEILDEIPDTTYCLIDYLGEAPAGVMSYRGYYEDLAIEPGGESLTVKGLHAILRAALGETFTGYKGGDYVMKADTPLWVARYGATGRALVDIRDEVVDTGYVILVTKDVEL